MISSVDCDPSTGIKRVYHRSAAFENILVSVVFLGIAISVFSPPLDSFFTVLLSARLISTSSRLPPITNSMKIEERPCFLPVSFKRMFEMRNLNVLPFCCVFAFSSLSARSSISSLSSLIFVASSFSNSSSFPFSDALLFFFALDFFDFDLKPKRVLGLFSFFSSSLRMFVISTSSFPSLDGEDSRPITWSSSSLDMSLSSSLCSNGASSLSSSSKSSLSRPPPCL
mmetsp:Transcript_43208/g.70230  ORF Transcript_43208/g.70230 Transcript_43208/m.70230 type:complete len:226 (-) Transcript_43208:94-771(-)